MADVWQVLEDTPARPQAKVYSAGALTDLDGPAGGTCTVTLTRPDGTAGPASGTVTHVSTGVYEIVIDGQPDPTYFDVHWAGTIGAKAVTVHTRVEWLGALLFNTADLRAFKVGNGYPFAADATPLFSNQRLMDARTAVLDELQAILGFSPVPRFRRKVLSGDGSTCLNLPDLFAHRLISLTINGVAQTVTDYAVTDSAQLEAISNYGPGAAFTQGRRNVVVEYAHGWERVVGLGRDAAMVMAAKELLPSGFSNFQTVSTPDGMSYSYEPSEVGRSGFQRFTGVRDLDRWLNRHSQLGIAVA